MDGSKNPVSGIGDGVFILDILMKHAKCTACRSKAPSLKVEMGYE